MSRGDWDPLVWNFNGDTEVGGQVMMLTPTPTLTPGPMLTSLNDLTRACGRDDTPAQTRTTSSETVIYSPTHTHANTHTHTRTHHHHHTTTPHYTTTRHHSHRSRFPWWSGQQWQHDCGLGPRHHARQPRVRRGGCRDCVQNQPRVPGQLITCIPGDEQIGGWWYGAKV